MKVWVSAVQSIYEIIGKTNAIKSPAYIPIYERLFEPIRLMPISILELGVFNGGSIKVWEQYFPYAKIAGIDLNPPALDVSNRVRLYKGD